MMMALRNSPSEYALINALDGANAPKGPSRALVVAIGVSVALHLGLFTYLYLERVGMTPLATAASGPITLVDTIRLQPNPPQPKPHPQPQPRGFTVHTPPLAPATPTRTANPFTPTPQLQTPTGLAPFTAFTPTEPTPRQITDPKWLSQPTAEEMSRFYPPADVDRGITGDVALICGVVASGRLADCRVASETPAGAKFGEAALKLSAFFRMTPRTVDGQPVDGGQTRISIAFRLNDAPGG